MVRRLLLSVNFCMWDLGATKNSRYTAVIAKRKRSWLACVDWESTRGGGVYAVHGGCWAFVYRQWGSGGICDRWSSFEEMDQVFLGKCWNLVVWIWRMGMFWKLIAYSSEWILWGLLTLCLLPIESCCGRTIDFIWISSAQRVEARLIKRLLILGSRI